MPSVVEPRPFYIIQHNPNSISEVLEALAGGANAIEPDINIFADNPEALCVSHTQGDDSDLTLVEYLQGLHDVVMEHPELALIIFDCKEEVATADRGVEILQAIRTHLTHDNQVKVILSVGKLADGDLFTKICTMLGPNEGGMIDEEGDPRRVVAFFSQLGIHNQCHGNGISVMNSTIGPLYRYSTEEACELRAGTNLPKFINTWTVNNVDDMCEYIRIGVDSLITDEVATLQEVVQSPEFTAIIRMATRSDDPFTPANYAYGLTIYTGDIFLAGTDESITFTLRGTEGAVSKTIDASLIKRMERGSTNHVAISSVNLGDLESITVQHDNPGIGHDWYLDRIEVRSHEFGTSSQALFDCWIEGKIAQTKPLVPA